MSGLCLFNANGVHEGRFWPQLQNPKMMTAVCIHIQYSKSAIYSLLNTIRHIFAAQPK